MKSFRCINLFLIFVSFVFYMQTEAIRRCNQDDLHYEFTECDENGHRWRVSIPSSDCHGGQMEPPVKVSDCSVSCDQGSFFNLTKLSCEKCPPGTYSLGGGVHFDSWSRLPNGFHARTESFRSAFSFGRRRGDVDCEKFGWEPRNDVLASKGGPCAAVLVYSVRLVKPGSLTYTYQYTDADIIFEFEAQNELCQSVDNADESKWPPLTGEGEWKSVTVNLKTGLNVLHWKTIGIDMRHSARPVMIKTIQISGVAYTSECSLCSAGTYSREGARQCKECSEGSYSPLGADSCSKCEDRSEYAPKGSSHCFRRPPCTAQDYYEIDSPCDHRNKTRAVYRWVEPQICREDLRGSTILPPSGELKTCPPCNPGMHFTTGKSNPGCEFCLKNEYSDGRSACKACPPSTSPNYGHQYQWWSELPPDMAVTCMSAEDSGCGKQHKAWQPSGDHVHSGVGHADDAYLVLSLKVKGFRGRDGFINGRPMEVGRISFTFELFCTAQCEFVFMEGSARKGVTILQSWTGRQPKQYYNYLITRNDTYTFSWAYQKVSWEKSYLRSPSIRSFEGDMAKIFNINVTNTIDGGASMCLPCPQGVKGLGCIPCPPGHYIEENTTKCVYCGPNKVVTDALPYGPDSCIPCGPGLTSVDGLTCIIQCNLTVENEHYDLANISRARAVKGSTLFTSSGTKYFHMFNLSLCGDQIVTCANNVSYNMQGESSVVEARACRSTIVPSMDREMKGRGSSLATQSVSLGDHLLGVSKNSSLHGIKVIDEFIDPSKKYLHFFYSTPSATRACPEGRSSTVTLKCSPEESGQGQVSLPHECPDGTCDGCNFHFLWETQLACPICSENDLIVVRGECTDGQRRIHYISPGHCRSPDVIPESQMEACEARLPFMVEVIILSALSTAVLLCLLLFCLWKKNKKLEYKYMKLIANSGPKDGLMELPPAESCALDDGEEDEIQFAKKPPKGILSKFKNKTSEYSA